MEICIWSFSDLLALHHNQLKVSARVSVLISFYSKNLFVNAEF